MSGTSKRSIAEIILDRIKRGSRPSTATTRPSQIPIARPRRPRLNGPRFGARKVFECRPDSADDDRTCEAGTRKPETYQWSYPRFLTMCDDGSKLPVHFRHDGSSMTYAVQNSAEIPSRQPKSAMAGIVASNLDIGLVTAVVAAEDALARLDERLAKSPNSRRLDRPRAFSDACASLWLAGEVVHLEDLVLHDAAMDLRVPTHELTPAHAVLRARRRIKGAAAGRFLHGQLDGLRAQAEGDAAMQEETGPLLVDEDDPLAEEFAAIDAAIECSSLVLREGAGAHRAAAF